MNPPWKDPNCRLLLCLGPGGVGKTTIASALAIRAAIAGRDVSVLTIDPAPRLLDALGLDPAESAPQPVELSGVAPRAATMRALKLDPKRTFDAVVNRYALSASMAGAIMENRLYDNLSSSLAGVGEYMAMEKLLELYHDSGTDLIVVDTPPAAEALDFLDAPQRLLDLLNSRATVLLSDTIHRGLKVSDYAARAVLSAFDRLTRLGLLHEVQGLVSSFEGMYQGFADRAAEAASLLRSEQCTVIVVTTAEQTRIDECLEFIDTLEQAGIKLKGLLINRALPPVPARLRKDARIAPSLRRKVEQARREFAALKERDQRSMAALAEFLPPGSPIFSAPDLGHELNDLTDLASLARRIAPAASRRRRARV